MKLDSGDTIQVVKPDTSVSYYLPIYDPSIITIVDRTRPLIIINGVVSNKKVNAINPYDIQSINLLRDKSVTALYGEKGKNGVISITTKKKSAGQDEYQPSEENPAVKPYKVTVNSDHPEHFIPDQPDK